MFRRAALISLLLFQTVWLTAVLPGHTRGVVTLPGYKSAAGHEVSDCCHPAPAGKNDPSQPADPTRAAHCAICFFAARLTVPVVIDLTPRALELAFVRPVPVAERVASLEFIPTYLGRAPPAA